MTKWLLTFFFFNVTCVSFAETDFQRARAKFKDATTLEDSAISDTIYQDCVFIDRILSMKPLEAKLTLVKNEMELIKLKKSEDYAFFVTELDYYKYKNSGVFEGNDRRNFMLRRSASGEIIGEMANKRWLDEKKEEEEEEEEKSEDYEETDGDLKGEVVKSIADARRDVDAYLFCHTPTWKKELDKRE